MAVVTRTGFLTSKGGLVRSIMYPPPVDFKFQQDSYKFIGVLAAIASIGFVYTVITKVRHALLHFSLVDSRRMSICEAEERLTLNMLLQLHSYTCY